MGDKAAPEGGTHVYEAFEWLEKTFEGHDNTNWCIKVEPMFDDLHSNPMWTKLMERMGLAD
jgi:hypothetical protein